MKIIPMLMVAAISVPAAAEPQSIRIDGFAAPESMLYDRQRDEYLVSNVSGDPFSADHDGFISRVSPDGRIVALRFIDGGGAADGLSAPKGMAIAGRVLYVADLDRVRLYDADSGAARGAIVVAGASLLNDLVAAPDGTVYASDSGVVRDGAGMKATGNDGIYALREGTPARRIAAGDLGRPNGLEWHDGRLDVVTLGSGEWITVGLDGEVQRRVAMPKGMLDGVVRLEGGDLLISSWLGSGIYRVNPSGKAALVLSSPSPADIGYDPRRRRLLVPVMTENRVWITELPR